MGWLDDNTATVIAALRDADYSTADDGECVTARALLAQIIDAARGCEAAVDLRLVELLPAGASTALPGVGQVIVEAKGKQVTHGAKLAVRVAALVADKPPCNEDGEPLPPAEWCRLTAEDMVAVFGLDTPSTGFRAGEVKKRGLSAGEFRTYEDGQPRVRFIDGASR